MNDLTTSEKWDYINIQVTKDYPKMAADAKRITSYNSEQFEDLLPFCIAELLTKKSIDYLYKLIVLDKALPNFMGKSMSLNLRSSTSPFWSKYRREGYNSRGIYLKETDKAYIQGEFEEITEWDTPAEHIDSFECMMAALNKLDFYHSALLNDYFIKEMTFKAMNEKYGISLAHLRKDIDHGIKLIQQHCNHFLK